MVGELCDINLSRPWPEVHVACCLEGALDPGLWHPTVRTKHLNVPSTPMGHQEATFRVKVHPVRSSSILTCTDYFVKKGPKVSQTQAKWEVVANVLTYYLVTQHKERML